MSVPGRAFAAVLALGTLLQPPPAFAERALTLYIGRISRANAWHDIVTEPWAAEFVDAYVAVAAFSHELDRRLDGRLSIEGEVQVAYDFGDQSHWEFNVAAGPRWHEFPWNDTVATTAAFALGLSRASEVPPVEVELEEKSEKLLVYWMAELTFARPRSPWALSLRMHHRSPGFGLFGNDGGMNAVALGVRRAF